jgi:hypothetical protein
VAVVVRREHITAAAQNEAGEGRHEANIEQEAAAGPLLSGPQQFTARAPISSVPYVRVMRTTIEISDPLLREARKLAEREGVTLRALVERGLRRVIAETKPGAPFKLRRASFKGRGLKADLRGASWDKLRDLAYEGRGG